MPSLKKFRLNTDAMDHGVWQTFYTSPDGKSEIRACVASTSSPAYLKAVETITRRRRAEIKANGGQLPTETLHAIQREAAGMSLLNDWTGIENDDGSPIQFSRPMAIEFMTNREYSEFYDWVMEIANGRSSYRQEAIEEAAKNSSSASRGS